MTKFAINCQSHTWKLQEESLPPCLQYSCFYPPKIWHFSSLPHSHTGICACWWSHTSFSVSAVPWTWLSSTWLLLKHVACFYLGHLMAPKSFCSGDLSFISVMFRFRPHHRGRSVITPRTPLEACPFTDEFPFKTGECCSSLSISVVPNWFSIIPVLYKKLFVAKGNTCKGPLSVAGWKGLGRWPTPTCRVSQEIRSGSQNLSYQYYYIYQHNL